jgi:hypothetical protein
MKAVDFLRRLEGKEFFKEFKKENEDLHLCAVFCILSKEETEGDKVTLDFFIPSKKKVAFSESPFESICFSEEEGKEYPEIKELDKIKMDVEDLWEEVERIKKEKKVSHNTGKIIGVLTNEEWSLTCLSPSIDLLRIKVNSKTKEVLSIKKEGLGDMIKINKKN